MIRIYFACRVDNKKPSSQWPEGLFAESICVYLLELYDTTCFLEGFLGCFSIFFFGTFKYCLRQ